MADEFDTDKGVKDDFDGLVIEAFFQANERGDTELVLKKRSENPEDNGEEVEDRYRVGQEWASFDGGQTVEHASKSKVRADSQLATLVERAMACGPEAEKLIRERSAANGSLGQKTAALWPGTRWHWDVEAKPYSFKDRETGDQQEGTSYKSYPSKFLGVGEVADASGSGSSTESTASSTAAPAEAPPEVIAKLKILAASHPFAEWVDEALTIDYVRENMISALGNEAFYNSLKE